MLKPHVVMPSASVMLLSVSLRRCDRRVQQTRRVQHLC